MLTAYVKMMAAVETFVIPSTHATTEACKRHLRLAFADGGFSR